jgi:hypothetical protein
VRNVPNSKPPPTNEEPLPFVIVGGEEFPLKRYSLRPYPRVATQTMRTRKFTTTDCEGHAELLRMLSAFLLKNVGCFVAEFN